MSEALVSIIGLADVQKMLAEMPKHVVVSGFAKALNAGATVIEQTLQVLTPESELDRDDGQHMVDSLVIDVQVDSNGRGGYAEVGYGKQGYKANLVEYGHVMVTHKNQGSREVGFVPPHPFMRPAFEQSSDAAIAAVQESILQTVDQEYPNG